MDESQHMTWWWRAREVGIGTYVMPGPVDASTERGLVRVYPVVYDVNGYYAALGIEPSATRREIREAYQQLDGQTSPRLTYIVKQLLNPEVRARYDAMPLGSLLYDEEVEMWHRRIRVHEMTMLLRQGFAEVADKLAEEDVRVSLDDLVSARQDVPNSSFETVRAGWGWGYFLRYSQCLDEARLSRWQEALVRSLDRRAARLRLAVGFSGDMESPWGVTQIGHTTVVFLHEEMWPTEALAEQAASRVVQHLQDTDVPGVAGARMEMEIK